MKLKRCAPFGHKFYRWESEDYWGRKCLRCPKSTGFMDSGLASKAVFYSDRTDIPSGPVELRPPKWWAKLPTYTEAVHQNSWASR